MEENRKLKFIKVISVNNVGTLSFIKSLLEDKDIPYYITNENFSVFYGGADGLTRMDIMVREDKLRETKDILKGFI